MTSKAWVGWREAEKISGKSYFSILSLVKKYGNNKNSIRTILYGKKKKLYNRHDLKLYEDCSKQRNGWVLLSRLNKHIQWKGNIPLAIRLGQIKCKTRKFGCLTYCYLPSIKTDGSGRTKGVYNNESYSEPSRIRRHKNKKKTPEEIRAYLAYRRCVSFDSQRKALKVIEGLIAGQGRGWARPIEKAKRIAEDMIIFGKGVRVDGKMLDSRGKTLMNMLGQAESSARRMFSFYSRARALFAEAELLSRITKDLNSGKKENRKKGKKK